MLHLQFCCWDPPLHAQISRHQRPITCRAILTATSYLGAKGRVLVISPFFAESAEKVTWKVSLTFQKYPHTVAATRPSRAYCRRSVWRATQSARGPCMPPELGLQHIANAYLRRLSPRPPRTGPLAHRLIGASVHIQITPFCGIGRCQQGVESQPRPSSTNYSTADIETLPSDVLADGCSSATRMAL